MHINFDISNQNLDTQYPCSMLPINLWNHGQHTQGRRQKFFSGGGARWKKLKYFLFRGWPKKKNFMFLVRKKANRCGADRRRRQKFFLNFDYFYPFSRQFSFTFSHFGEGHGPHAPPLATPLSTRYAPDFCCGQNKSGWIFWTNAYSRHIFRHSSFYS